MPSWTDSPSTYAPPNIGFMDELTVCTRLNSICSWSKHPLSNVNRSLWCCPAGLFESAIDLCLSRCVWISEGDIAISHSIHRMMCKEVLIMQLTLYSSGGNWRADCGWGGGLCGAGATSSWWFLWARLGGVGPVLSSNGLLRRTYLSFLEKWDLKCFFKVSLCIWAMLHTGHSRPFSFLITVKSFSSILIMSDELYLYNSIRHNIPAPCKITSLQWKFLICLCSFSPSQYWILQSVHIWLKINRSLNLGRQ